jgi:hypothetical protein
MDSEQRDAVVPQLRFHVLRGYLDVLRRWTANDPSLAALSHVSGDDLFQEIMQATDALRKLMQGREQDILRSIATLSRFEWTESIIDVYPSFAAPSFSHPLNLRVVEITETGVTSRIPEETLGTLVHELGHRIAPSTAFADRAAYEDAMGALAVQLLREHGIDERPYVAFTRRIQRPGKPKAA